MVAVATGVSFLSNSEEAAAADDTAYLNTLLRNGGMILLEPRTYFISGDLVVAIDESNLIGSGRTVIQKTRACQIVITANRCLVEGVTVEGNHQAGSGFFISGSFNSIVRCWSQNNDGGPPPQAAHGFFVNGSFNSILGCGSQNNQGIGFGFDGGYLGSGDDLTSTSCKFNEIRNCFAMRNRDIGISQYRHWDGRIVGNACFDNGLEGITVDVWSLRNLVMGNSLQNNCWRGGVGAIGMDFADLNRITNNFVEQQRGGPSDSRSGITLQNNIGQSNYNIIAQNIIVNPSDGIVLKASWHNTSPNPRDVSLQPAPRTSNNNLVIDNIIRGAGSAGVVQEPGCVGNDIRGNKVTS
jgi:hypothetical protein